MTQIEPFESASNLMEDMGMFEAATHAGAIQLAEVKVNTILALPDGSNQDPATQFLANELSHKLGATLVVKHQLETVKSVLEAVEATHAELLVLPVPFGADIGTLKMDSLGDFCDRILSHITVPVLAVRQPLSEAVLKATLQRMVVPLNTQEPRSAVAMSWACRLLQTGGELVALEIGDTHTEIEANQLQKPFDNLDSTHQAAIERVLSRHFAGLIATLQKKSAEFGFGTTVRSVRGRFVDCTLDAIGELAGLAVVAQSTDRRSDTFHRCSDLLLGSSFPVLMV